MFLRTTKVKRSDGTVDEYIRLVESDWTAGRPRHRVICNLGRKELLAPHAEALLRLLQGKTKSPAVRAEAAAVGAWDWGVMLVARALLATARSRGDPRLVGEATWPEARTGGPCSRLGEQS